MRDNHGQAQNSSKAARRMQSAVIRGARSVRVAEERLAALQNEINGVAVHSRQRRCRPEPEDGEEEEYDEGQERGRPRRRTAANAIFVE